MTDRPVLDDFELHLADELARHAAVARDPRPTRLVAAEAMRLGQRRTWVWPLSPGRLLMVAATFLMSLAFALAVVGALRSSPAPAGIDRAIVLRPADGAMDVILAGFDGSERALRHLTAEGLGLGPDDVIGSGWSLGPGGWLAVSVDSTLDQDYHASRTVFVDLADPARPPIILPSNGYVSPRWGPDGRAAVVCGPAPDCGQDPPVQGALVDGEHRAVVRVLDPEGASQTIVHGVQQFGGTPAPIWASLSSDARFSNEGFLYADEQGWGVQPLDGGPVMRGAPRLLSAGYRLTPAVPSTVPEPATASTIGRQWLGDLLAPAVVVAGINAADGEAIWLLLDETSGSGHQAIVAKLSDAGVVASVDRFDVPAPVTGFVVSDDETMVALGLGVDAPGPFVIASLTDDVAPAVGAPAIDGVVVGLIPATKAQAWPNG